MSLPRKSALYTLAVSILLISLPAFAQIDAFSRVGAWPYGPSNSVDVDPARQLAFLGSGGVVLVLDISDKTAPVLLSEEIHTHGVAYDVFYDKANQYLHIACGEGGFELWDVSDPVWPERLAITEVLYFGYDTPVGNVDVFGDFAIVECEWGYVHSLDFSDPFNPVDVSFNGLMGNPARDLHVSDDGQAHTTGGDRYQRLRIEFDGTIRNSGYKDYTWGPSTVFGTDEVAYVGYSSYLHIVDILYPGWPLWSSTYVGGILDMVEKDGILYIISGDRLQIWNVQTHNNPYFLGSLTIDFYYSDRIVVSGQYAYVTQGSGGLRIIDVSDSAAPVQVGQYETLHVTWDTIYEGDRAYLAHDTDGVFTLDMTDLSRPELIHAWEMPGVARHLAGEDERLYAAALNGGLRIASLADPSAPAELGAYEDISAWRVEVADNLAYVIHSVANQPDFLRVLDASDPAGVLLLGELELPSIIWDLEKVGDIIYVGAGDDGIRIIDVSDPHAPVEVDQVYRSNVHELVARNGLLYVTCFDSFDGGLYIFDISDPAAPLQLSWLNETGVAPGHISLAGDYAYIGDFEYLHCILISDPTAPIDLGEYTMPGDFFTVTSRDELVLVSDGVAGLQLVENLHYEDPGGGLSWEVLDSDVSEHLFGVQFVDRDRGWVVGEDGLILHTVNGGDDWEIQPSGIATDLNDLCFLDANLGWAVGSGGRILKTVDGGLSWSILPSGTGELLNAMVFIDENEGWVVGSGPIILHTTDGGASWQQQSCPTGYGLSDVDFVDSEHGWIAGGDAGQILRSNNGGENWYIVNTGSIYPFFAIDFVSTTTGWAVGMFGEIMKTVNGGLSWADQEGEHPPAWLYDVFFLDENRGWNVGFDGKIQSTTDGGELWSTQLTGNPSELHGVHFVDASAGWAVGWDGTILRALGGSTAVGEGSDGTASAAPSKLTCHPNPFNPSTKLSFQLPAGAQVRLEIYDTAGRKVRTLLDGFLNAGPVAATWDGRDGGGKALSSGVYLARLDMSGEIATSKLVLLK